MSAVSPQQTKEESWARLNVGFVRPRQSVGKQQRLIQRQMKGKIKEREENRWEVVLTVDIPANAPGGQLEGVVDALQDGLKLLLLGDFRLGHLGHVQLLAFQLLCATRQKDRGSNEKEGRCLNADWSSTRREEENQGWHSLHLVVFMPTMSKLCDTIVQHLPTYILLCSFHSLPWRCALSAGAVNNQVKTMTVFLLLPSIMEKHSKETVEKWLNN